MKIYIKGSDDFYLFIKNLCETHNVSTNIIGKDNKMYYNLDPIQKGVWTGKHFFIDYTGYPSSERKEISFQEFMSHYKDEFLSKVLYLTTPTYSII